MANKVYIATSLDGYIADRDGNLDWLMRYSDPEGGDFGYSEFISGIDAIVMGRNTCEKVLSMVEEWPYTLPVFILSHSLNTLPAELQGHDVQIMKGKPADIVADLNNQGYNNLYIDGGIVIQQFLQADLIDELILTQAPVLLGDGFPLFGALETPLDFRYVKSEVYDDTLIKGFYERVRS